MICVCCAAWEEALAEARAVAALASQLPDEGQRGGRGGVER